MKTELPTQDPTEEVYAEFDEEFEWYGVFGLNSGFCYATFCDENQAEDKAKQINTSRGFNTKALIETPYSFMAGAIRQTLAANGN